MHDKPTWLNTHLFYESCFLLSKLLIISVEFNLHMEVFAIVSKYEFNFYFAILEYSAINDEIIFKAKLKLSCEVI